MKQNLFFKLTGFHLSATVHQPHSLCQSKGTFNVAVTFDRGRITSCNCTCEKSATWCAHVIALCLFRIHSPNLVCLRAPVSEYLSRLRRDQLQKFAQYLISELPQQVSIDLHLHELSLLTNNFLMIILFTVLRGFLHPWA